jgi:hypothetical protein
MTMTMTMTEEGKLACSSLRSPGGVGTRIRKGRVKWGELEGREAGAEPSWQLALHQSISTWVRILVDRRKNN